MSSTPHVPPAGPEAPARASGAAAPAETDSLLVLVVDDEPAIVEQLAAGLKTLGMPALTASSAAQALAILAEQPRISVLVTDIRMPEQDGLHLAHRVLQERPDTQAVEIILITGHATIADATAAVRTGVSDFLQKPFRLAEVARAVIRAHGRAMARRLKAAELNAQQARLGAAEAERQALQGRLQEAMQRLHRLTAGSGMAAGQQRDLHAISHALRTPLVAIAGGTDMLSASDPEESREVPLRLLQEGVQRAVDAVALVEELHRLEAAAPVEPGVVELQGCIRNAVARQSTAAEARQLRLSWQADGAQLVRGDAAQVTRTVELCLGAAFEAAQPGQVVGITQATGGPNSPGWATVTVRVDTLAPRAETAPLPAGPVFPDTASLYSRTQEGLRFSVARRIAERLGGHLTSYSGGGCIAIRLALHH